MVKAYHVFCSTFPNGAMVLVHSSPLVLAFDTLFPVSLEFAPICLPLFPLLFVLGLGQVDFAELPAPVRAFDFVSSFVRTLELPFETL